MAISRRHFLAGSLSLAAAAAATPAYAAKWSSVRDAAMTARERGQALEAYNLVVNNVPSAAREKTDRHFLAGFLALRSLGNASQAAAHFQEMAVSTSELPSSSRTSERSAAGYWLGRSLTAIGRVDDAKAMYVAAAGYRDTFYGQMAASSVGIQSTKATFETYRDHYPEMDIFWHDPRIRRELVLAVIRSESSFRQGAVSPAGAKGLMQIMDGTAIMTGSLAGVNIDLSMVARNGNYNVAVGSKILADLVDDFNGNVMLAAGGYNAGPAKPVEWIKRFGDPRGNVDPVDWVELCPWSETRLYMKRVVSTYIVYLGMGLAS